MHLCTNKVLLWSWMDKKIDKWMMTSWKTDVHEKSEVLLNLVALLALCPIVCLTLYTETNPLRQSLAVTEHGGVQCLSVLEHNTCHSQWESSYGGESLTLRLYLKTWHVLHIWEWQDEGDNLKSSFLNYLVHLVYMYWVDSITQQLECNQKIIIMQSVTTAEIHANIDLVIAGCCTRLH